MAENNKTAAGNSPADALLDQLLEEASSGTPEPSSEFMARVLDDALAGRPAPGGSANARRSWIGNILSGIGGIPGAGGLVTAGIVGLWIGVSPPEMLETNASGLWDWFGTDMTASWSSYGDIL